MKKTKLIWLVLFSINVLYAFAQTFAFRNFTIKNGLPSDEIQDVYQAQNNLLWISTFSGLCTFDGKNFVSDFKQKELENIIIKSINQNKKGQFIFTSWFNGLVTKENNSWDTIKAKDKLYSDRLNIVTTDSLDNTWSINKFGIVILKNNRVIRKISFQTLHLKFKNISGVILEKNNTLWLSSTSEGVLKFNTKTFKYEKFGTENGIGNKIVYTVKKINNKIIFTEYGGLTVYENGVFKKYQLPGNSDDNRVFNIEKYGNQEYIVSTEANGIFILNRDFKAIFHFTTENGLATNFIKKVIIDKEQNIIIATLDRGLQILSEKAFKLYTNKLYFDNEALINLFETNTGIFSQTESGNLFQVDLKNDSITFKKENLIPEIANNQINGIFNVNQTSYWATNKGILKFEAGKIEKLLIPDDDNMIFAIGPSLKSQELFIASNLYNYTYQQDSFKKVKVDRTINALSSHDVKKDKFNTIWLASSEGLGYFKDDIAHFYAEQKSNKVGMLAKLIPEDDNFWVCGLIKNYILIPNSNPQKSKLIEKSLAKLLHKKREQLLSVQNHTMFWIIDDKLVLIDSKDFLSNNISRIKTVFSFSDFINESIGFNNTVVRNNHLLISTSAGLISIEINHISKNKIPVTLEVNHVTLFSDSLPKQYNTAITNYNLILPYNKNYLTFHLNTISFKYPESINIKYRLLGQDTNWFETTLNKIVLSYLNPGKYILQLQAKNCDGIISNQVLEIPIYIKSPFWRTYWFYTFCLLAISSLFYFIYRAKVNKLKQEAAVQQKISGMIINSQEDERRRISKDLHDSVGQNLLAIKNNLKTNRSENTIELVDNTINEIREISRNLHPYQIDKIGITKTILNTFLQLEHHDIFVSEDVESFDGFLSEANQVNLYRVIQEICNNIIKHAKASAANIEVPRFDKTLNIHIKDNGKGFNFEQNKENVLKSFGLSSIQERIKIMNAEINYYSEPNKGTYIHIIIYKHENN